MVSANDWHDLPLEFTARWRKLFAQSTEGVRLSAACPVCGARALYRWFNLSRPKRLEEYGQVWQGKGGQWQWCRACRNYEHSSGLVPEWWHTDLFVDPHTLMHDPGAIDAAIAASERAQDWHRNGGGSKPPKELGDRRRPADG